MESISKVFNSVDSANNFFSSASSSVPSPTLDMKKKNKSAVGIRPSMGKGRMSVFIGSFSSAIAAKKSTLFRKASIVYPKERSSLIEAKESPFDLNFLTLKKRENSILA
jgi:hypothetical protein